jgi:hypothetical protein
MFLQVVIYQYDYKISVIVLHVSIVIEIFLKMLANDAKKQHQEIEIEISSFLSHQ